MNRKEELTRRLFALAREKRENIENDFLDNFEEALNQKDIIEACRCKINIDFLDKMKVKK